MMMETEAEVETELGAALPGAGSDPEAAGGEEGEQPGSTGLQEGD